MYKMTIKAMAVEAAAACPRELRKPYYETAKDWTRNWQAYKHGTDIARQYAQTLAFITDLLSTNPETVISLAGDVLRFQWKNGEGTMKMDCVDMAVLIPRIEQLTGSILGGTRFKKAA